MTTKRRYSCDIDRREEQHLNLLEELDVLNLSDSCCEICHCDCYNSHRSINVDVDEFNDDCSVDKVLKRIAPKKLTNKKVNEGKSKSQADGNNNNYYKSAEKRKSNRATDKINTKGKVKKKRSSLDRTRLDPEETGRARSKSPCISINVQPRRKSLTLRRSKSAGSLHSTQNSTKYHFTRDCELLQDLLTSFNTPRFEVTNHMRTPLPIAMQTYSKSTLELPTTSKAAKIETSWSTPKICESLANLCLAPTIREAYQKVPTHDKKILNRMANKRSEKLIAKENAWLARKFWENERYERELFKCEQMEEYKRAVRDKQFQDYLLTKERLNELAQRDYQELQRLRQALAHKDTLTKQRLEALRIERGIAICQKRCDDLKKNETVNLNQEEQQLGDLLRKQEICSRLTDRLRRAGEIRNQMLEGYLRRLRYDNYVEQVMHDQHWRETQELESMKRAQLKEHINAKSKGTKRFIEQRQRRMEAMTKTAKISASLRELVKSSVVPEGALSTTTLSYTTTTANLGKILFDRPISKLSNKC